MKKIEIEDIVTYQFPENLQMSPDGTYAAFQAARSDTKKNCYHRDIHLIKDGKDVQLTANADCSVLLWQDDRHLLLTRTGEKEEETPGTEIYRIDVTGGEAQKYWHLPVQVNQLIKGDKYYAVIASVDVNNPDAYLHKEEKKDPFEKDYQEASELPYWFNGAGFINGKRSVLFRFDPEKKKLQRITDTDIDVNNVTMDNDMVYFTANKRKQVAAQTEQVYSCDLYTCEVKCLYAKEDRAFAHLFVENGVLYALAADLSKYGLNTTPDMVKVQGGELETVYVPGYSWGCGLCFDTMLGGGSVFVEDRDTFYSLMTVEDHSEIYAYKNGVPAFVVKDEAIPFFDVKGDILIYCAIHWDSPGELYSLNLKTGKTKQLTQLNKKAVQGKYIAEPERVDYESAGYSLHGWVLLPEEEKESIPAVLDVHGGPRAVYGTNFFHEMQVWVSKGYAVMFTNIKGSDGRGDAFADIRDDYGGTDFQNLMDFVGAVMAKYPQIDSKRLCETGGSYGGFMTNWIITHTDRFCCAASQRSISNWVSFSLISDIGPTFGPDQCGAKGLFGDTNTEFLWKHSPLKYVENCHTPTLFIHSDQDYRCPLPEGMQMMQALATRGVDTKMVIFHGENHELSRGGKPVHRMKRLREITGWFDRYTN